MTDTNALSQRAELRWLVSVSHPTPHPWLSDHRIFLGYRWLTWLVTALWLVGQAGWANFTSVLAGSLVLLLGLTLLSRRYLRLTEHLPAVLLLDILLAIVAIMFSGGWDSPFFFYGLGSLVIPSLLFGWRGGFLAGLMFVAMHQAGLLAAGTPVAERMFSSVLDSASVPLALIVPPCFGALFAVIVEQIRRQSIAHQRHGRSDTPDIEHIFRGSDYEPPQFIVPRTSTLDSLPLSSDTRLAAQVMHTRKTDKDIEELRRLLFAPLPAPDMDFGSTLDVLSTRFEQQTNVSTHISFIGRRLLVRPLCADLLIRVAREALLNIHQHAQARSVSLTVRYDINTVALLIQDDGVGLIEGSHERPGLHALRAMHYRITELGGRMDVFETQGGGVTVRATLPID